MTMRQYNEDYHSIEAEKALRDNKYLLYDTDSGYWLSREKPSEYKMVDRFTFAYKSIRREGNFLARWADTKDYQEIRHLLTLSP